MTVRGIDLGSIVTPYRSPYSGDFGGRFLDSMRFRMEQERLRSGQAAQQKIQEQQELRLMQQAGLDNILRSQQLEAEKRLKEAALKQDADEAAAMRGEREQSRQDEAFGNLYKAIQTGDQDTVDAYLQDLGRKGFTIEKGGGEASTQPAAPEPIKAPEAAQAGVSAAPGPQPGPGPKMAAAPISESAKKTSKAKGKDEATSKQLDKLKADTVGELAPDTGLADQPVGIDEPYVRPAPARAKIENPGEAAIVESAGVPEEASGAFVEAPVSGPQKLPPAMADPELPPAMVEQGFAGYRIRDKNGKVVFEFDPSKLGSKRGKLGEGALGAISVTGQGARNEEEQRAAGMAYAMAQKLIQGGMAPDKAYAEARKGYEFELERLGKVRQFGGGGVPSAGLSGKEHDKRFSQIMQLTTRDTRLANLQKLNQTLQESEVATANLTGKGGFAQLNGLVHIIKGAQGGRVSDTDQRQAYAAAMGKVQQLQHLYNQYATSDVPMPPEAIANIQEAQRLSGEYLKLVRRKTAIETAKSAATNPDIKFADDAERDKMAAWVARDLLQGEAVTPDEVAVSGKQEQKPSGQPAKPQKSKKDLAAALIRKM